MVTIATNETDGYKRFMRSAKTFGLDVEVYLHTLQCNLYHSIVLYYSVVL